MKPPRQRRPRSADSTQRRQICSQEIIDQLLAFIQAKFYSGRAVDFEVDRPQLLKLVVFKFARYLDNRGVTVTPDRYLQIVRETLMDAARFGRIESVKYIPAYLCMVIGEHLRHHGEDYYYAAKSARDLVPGALGLAKGSVGPAPDPVRELAQAARLLKKAASKRPFKRASKGQLDLL